MSTRLACMVGWQLCLPMAVAQLPPVPEPTEAESVLRPKLYIAQRVHDLGTILEGDKHIVRWRLENRGSADLIIERTQASCGCVVARLTDEQKTIPPGESLELTAEFDSRGRRGPQSKSVTVYSNDPVEPTLKLEFTADLQFLYIVKPPGLVNLRAVRRGQVAAKTIDILPGSGRKSVEILDLQVSGGGPLSLSAEPLNGVGGTGQRIRISIGEHAALGTLKAQATIKLRVDGIERERVVSIRGEVVGELTWHPKLVDQTRQGSRPGKRFAPVTIRSTDKASFHLLSAEAGKWFDVTIEPAERGSKRTRYSIFLTLRDDAPVGPFAATLKIQTSSLDQPLVRVPIFGIVAAPIEVEPPVILLRQDGTPAGTHRRVKLQAWPQVKLTVSAIASDSIAVEATLDREASARYHHIRFLDVRLLSGRLPAGTHHAVLTLTTSVEGAQRMEIPVIIDVPG